jgi:hypothetical protein
MIRELIDTEVEAVSGGFSWYTPPVYNYTNYNFQGSTNTGGRGGDANGNNGGNNTGGAGGPGVVIQH